jgi:undecaprenyl-diphosphatase
MAELVLLSIIQGVTEFLPISSSAHLILVSNYFNLNNANLTLDISLHLGSFLAIAFYFRNDLINFIKNKELFKKILITSVPVSIFGFLLVKTNYIDILRNYSVIGWSTIIFGLILFFSDLKETNKNIKKNFSYNNAFFISFFQILSLIPGVSRSGIIITSARILKYNRIDSAKLSFLTSLPILAIVSVYNLQKIVINDSIEISLINFTGILFSFLISYLTIKLFIEFLKKFNLLIFVIYRVILGIIILLYVYN